MINAAWLIPLLPLVGFLINALGKKWLSKNIVSLVACGSVLGSFVIAAVIFIELLGGASAQTLSLGELMNAGGFSVSLSLLIDPLSVLMTLIITGIGFFIHVYSVGYMSHDEGFARYFSYLNLFVFSMLMLVLGANYILMFVGWEGVGFCSYLLIGFWFGDNANNDAAKKAFVMNRIGDVGFLTGVFLIFITFGSIEYAQVFSSAASMPAGLAVITTITLLLFIGATGKSAQIPLFTWLPDAMAGPTPVSALIHAATMVTAGIYMIVRSNILFTLAPITMEVITYVGVATALLGAFVAITQNDIKKVLAYSTVSQLGYMFVAVGVGAYSTGMFHLITHAFFKALLFLGAGSVIHAMSGEQDIRKMGGLKKDLTCNVSYFSCRSAGYRWFASFLGLLF
jgi:NADH-quinone oxidoreductase subunit L